MSPREAAAAVGAAARVLESVRWSQAASSAAEARLRGDIGDEELRLVLEYEMSPRGGGRETSCPPPGPASGIRDVWQEDGLVAAIEFALRD